ncbi:MAG TPA: DUF262 domain-containing protein, partial [Draconibacterium sp.]|nr:DUF262 domain-containing protein [Draconibacterium sp.]
MRKDKSASLADKLFPQLSESDIEILNIPPEKRRLSTETYDFTVSTINDYINSDHIVIPKFQRGYVWNRAQASRLIESLIINCPIPVIFLSQNSDETLAVIDGNQRLNSVKLFLEDDFQLKGLTAYPELEGFYFSELDPRFKRHIINRTIRCIVILKDTHPQIKFDVFERLNTGSVKLNPQELRHGIYNGKLMELIEEISKNKTWQSVSGTKQNKRMKGDELIIRYFALSENWRNYSKPLSGFLNNYAEQYRTPTEDKLSELKESFFQTFNVCHELFGDLAFKTFNKDFKQSKFNAALYDAQMVAVFETGLTKKKAKNLEKNKVLNKLRDLIHEEELTK